MMHAEGEPDYVMQHKQAPSQNDVPYNPFDGAFPSEPSLSLPDSQVSPSPFRHTVVATPPFQKRDIYTNNFSNPSLDNRGFGAGSAPNLYTEYVNNNYPIIMERPPSEPALATPAGTDRYISTLPQMQVPPVQMAPPMMPANTMPVVPPIQMAPMMPANTMPVVPPVQMAPPMMPVNTMLPPPTPITSTASGARPSHLVPPSADSSPLPTKFPVLSERAWIESPPITRYYAQQYGVAPPQRPSTQPQPVFVPPPVVVDPKAMEAGLAPPPTLVVHVNPRNVTYRQRWHEYEYAPWVCFLLGFLCIIPWFFGIPFRKSTNPTQRAGGYACVGMLVVTLILAILWLTAIWW